MVWVRSEYAGELAVLSVWITALLPWSVSFVRGTVAGSAVTVVNFRFPLFQLHYVLGVAFGRQSLRDLFQPLYRLPAFVPPDQVLEAWVWVAAGVVFALALLLSIAYYAREAAVADAIPVDPVRLFGGLLGLVAVALTAALVLFFPHQTTVPVGLPFIYVFAAVLLRIDRT